MTTLRAVLFDLDGVLVDSYQVWFRLMQAASLRFGGPSIDAESFRSMWGQGVDADAAFLECEIDPLETFYNEHFMSFGDALGIDPAGGPTFARVHAAGLESAVVTNTPTPLARDILAAAKLEPTTVVGGTDVLLPKPAPDMLLRACELLGVEPGHTVMIGDSTFDRDAARGAGSPFIGLRLDGERRIERLEQLPELLAI